MKPRFLRCGAFCAILCVLAACALAGCVSQTDPPAPAADVSEPAPVAQPASPLKEAFAAAYDEVAAQERAAYDEGRNPGGFMRARSAEDKAREARQMAWENRACPSMNGLNRIRFDRIVEREV